MDWSPRSLERAARRVLRGRYARVLVCSVAGAKMERAVAFNAWGTPLRFNAPWWFWNLFGEQAVFLLSRRG